MEMNKLLLGDIILFLGEVAMDCRGYKADEAKNLLKRIKNEMDNEDD